MDAVVDLVSDRLSDDVTVLVALILGCSSDDGKGEWLLLRLDVTCKTRELPLEELLGANCCVVSDGVIDWDAVDLCEFVKDELPR